MEWPRALTRALSLRVTDPDVRDPPLLRNLGRCPVGSTPAHEESLHCHVGRSEDNVDGVFLLSHSCKPLDLFGRQGFAERAVLVQDLLAEGEKERLLIIVAGFRCGRGSSFCQWSSTTRQLMAGSGMEMRGRGGMGWSWTNAVSFLAAREEWKKKEEMRKRSLRNSIAKGLLADSVCPLRLHWRQEGKPQKQLPSSSIHVLLNATENITSL
ncbi:hypothetical protein MRB53_033532 [Persea americana]|uniref:Uncharacterized protein n=1 Tax=Persea americana TaxID=3435 RepID=A0ACC2KUX6_PERAE|nr:hypothetical protein MRB53_033532 [Persea americana]